jgi:ribonuclease P/MRP protein subunit POP5
MLWATLTMMTSLPGISDNCILRVVHVSGTIKKAEQEVIRAAKATILKIEQAVKKSSGHTAFVANLVEIANKRVEKLDQEVLEISKDDQDDTDQEIDGDIEMENN